METRKLGVEDKKIILELEKLCFPNDRWNQEDLKLKKTVMRIHRKMDSNMCWR